MVTSKDGRVAHQVGASIDYSGVVKPVLLAHRLAGAGSATVGQARRDPITGRWFLPVVQSLPKSAGLAIAFIDIRQLAQPIRNAAMAASNGVHYVVAAGTVIATPPKNGVEARRKPVENLPVKLNAEDPPTQAVELTNHAGGTVWITAYRPSVGGLVLAAAVQKERVVSVWLEQRYAQLLTSVFAALLLLHFTVTIALHASRRRRAEGALRLAEIKLSEALEALSEGFALYDREDRLTLCNQRLRDMMPEAAEYLKIGAGYKELMLHGAESGYFLDADSTPRDWIEGRLAAHQKFLSSFELALASGTWLQISERRTYEGGTVAIVSDITRSKEREIALSEAKVEADTANHAKTDFLANMSHELRTPLNAIIGFAEIMERQMFGPLGKPQYNDYAEKIGTSAQHLLSIINDILDVSKIESGTFELSEENVSIAPLVGEAIALFANLSESKKVAVSNRISDPQLIMNIDRRAMKQVLINLISNAIKFTEPDGQVEVNAGIADTGEFVLGVSDNGIGVASANLKRVFEAFGQVEGAFARNHGGTGLGLPLVKGLIERHGGRIYFESDIGKGTTVTAVLPAERVVQPAIAAITA